MCESESLEEDKTCPICFEMETTGVFSTICTPGEVSPKNEPKCNHKICEACLVRMYLSNMTHCPFCRASWIPYFLDLAYRHRRFTDCLYQILFYGAYSDETNEYCNQCRFMLREHGRSYCLAILCDDQKRLMTC